MTTNKSRIIVRFNACLISHVTDSNLTYEDALKRWLPNSVT